MAACFEAIVFFFQYSDLLMISAVFIVDLWPDVEVIGGVENVLNQNLLGILVLTEL